MTDLLDEAVAKLADLPERKQDEIARQVLEIADASNHNEVL